MCVGWYSGKRLSTVALLEHGGELKNCEVPVLNMTSIRKFQCKKLLRNNIDYLRSSGIWDSG
jgi:hypothetical protein